MMKIKKFLYWIVGKEYKDESPPFPYDFIVVNFSSIALQNNIKDNQNKIIYRYTQSEFGKKIKKYPYSEARLKALIEVEKIPYVDLTKKETRFPIFAKILPSEVEYT